MDTRQKLGYMALGAGILAIGIAIGQWTTPDIEAQNNGVFDKIVCRKLEVVDENGNKAIVLATQELGNYLHVYDTIGKNAIILFASEDTNGVSVADKKGEYAVNLFGAEGAAVMLRNEKQKRSGGMLLDINEEGHGITIKGKAGEEAISLLAHEKYGVGITIYDRAGKLKWESP